MITRPVLTCEHASNRVPPHLAPAFARARAAIESHRGWDAGALSVARALARRLEVALFAGSVSRLVVDLNRSRTARGIFSAWTRALSRAEQEALLSRHWTPFRSAVREHIDAALESGACVAHVSVHSFTPRLGPKLRNADVGLLYDPARGRERRLADAIAAELGARAPGLSVRRNYPYRGIADGHTTALRRALPASVYTGLELELSQGLFDDAARAPRARRLVVDAVAAALADSARAG